MVSVVKDMLKRNIKIVADVVIHEMLSQDVAPVSHDGGGQWDFCCEVMMRTYNKSW